MNRLIATTFAAPLFLFSQPIDAISASINLGNVKIGLPSVSRRKKSSRSSRARRLARSRASSYRTHKRWKTTTTPDNYVWATNDQNIKIGYSKNGRLGLEVGQLLAMSPEFTPPQELNSTTTFPLEVEVNNRYFGTFPSWAFSPNGLSAVQSADLDRLIQRLKSGRSITMSLGSASLSTHLNGSSDAIEAVEQAAAIQRVLFARGQVNDQTKTAKKDDDSIKFYLPGVRSKGSCDVVFDIIEDKGLQLYVRFPQVEGSSDPAHKIAFSKTETERLIDMLRKARDWTDVAIENRVGLFTKRIGFVDDEHNPLPEEEPSVSDDAELAAEETNPEMSSDPEATKAVEAGPAPKDDIVASAESEQEDTSKQSLLSDPVEPSDYKAINFNSYEDASTSAQFEHSVRGYSRRFNLQLDEAMKLSDVLENTLELVSRRLENRDSSTDKKESLFK